MISIPFNVHTQCLNRRRDYKAQPFLFPLSGVCKNTACFLRADCCGTLKCTAVNSSYRITSRPVKLCVALSRLVTILVGVPAASDKVCCLLPYLACTGNLCTTFDRPSELKITPMRTEPENVLSISSCWRHQRAKTYPAFSFSLSSPFSSSSLPLCPSSLTLFPSS